VLAGTGSRVEINNNTDLSLLYYKDIQLKLNHKCSLRNTMRLSRVHTHTLLLKLNFIMIQNGTTYTIFTAKKGRKPFSYQHLCSSLSNISKTD
jgi:hypothetical protein